MTSGRLPGARVKAVTARIGRPLADREAAQFSNRAGRGARARLQQRAAPAVTWTCHCTCGSQADPGCPEGEHCGGDQCVGPGDSFVDDRA